MDQVAYKENANELVGFQLPGRRISLSWRKLHRCRDNSTVFRSAGSYAGCVINGGESSTRDLCPGSVVDPMRLNLGLSHNCIVKILKMFISSPYVYFFY